MRFDVFADLDHLFMLNFSVDADRLSRLVPAPLRVLEKRGRGFPSVVLPSIKRLRPVLTRFPSVDYELFGLRVLVEYDSQRQGTTKGIYFAKLIMDPTWVRMIAGLVTAFAFERGRIRKVRGDDGRCAITIDQGSARVLEASVRVEDDYPATLTDGSAFESSEEALATYNDISFGFLPNADGTEVKILQIAEPHPDYVAWPLVGLAVESARVRALHENPALEGATITPEPSYFVGTLPRYWRWLPTERLS